MNWITDFVRPKLQAIVGKKEVPDNLWETCSNCGQMLLKKELEKNLHVCTSCGNHFRISPEERLNLFFGKNFNIIETPKVKSDPLKFKDKQKYSERLKNSRKKNNKQDAIIVASGSFEENKVVCVIFDFKFMGGSMGIAVGEAILTASEYSKKNKLPLIIVSSSGGARMQEGILALMQMPRTIIAINNLSKQKIPFISVLADPTTGGVSASYAMLGDIVIAEKGATIGFAGSRVIEETIKEKLPQNFQKSEYLHSKGMVDIVVHRNKLNETIKNTLNLLKNNNI
ncbi:MAG: acetyl-CoA carboxylase carboxyl transferase subunit beta [Rickettsiales bacterium]|nr:acetyl-CoA carboxylase carboxyl transferase subunit beta [Rickettsiales bacterium]|tara:strand:- start:9 stop:860 length:852 start_codon:yes stop_codon:yes gene_type:complete